MTLSCKDANGNEAFYKDCFTNRHQVMVRNLEKNLLEIEDDLEPIFLEFEEKEELLKLNRTMEISTGTERWLKDQSPLGCSCRPLQAIRKGLIISRQTNF